MTDTKQIVDRAWAFSHVLRDDGLSYMAYTEQITFLLFLKMAEELAKKHPGKPRLIPAQLGWSTLLEKSGKSLLEHYEHILEALSRKKGMLGAIFQKPRPDIQNAATLRKLIVELIDPVEWTLLDADVKGDIYEGILAKSADESPKGAGQYFTPRDLITAIVECVEPTPSDTVCDPAAGTGGFLLSAHEYVRRRYGSRLTAAQSRHLEQRFVRGWELVPNTARLCVMNLFLHGVQADPCPIEVGADSLSKDPGERFSLILTNPPFGRKSTVAAGKEGGSKDENDQAYKRRDFWVTTKNKQINFLQHAKTLLASGGRCAIVVPDNVLFEGGAGETVRRELLEQFNVHTLLRLPTGIFYAQGVKANVLFFDSPQASRSPRGSLWVYDLRTRMRFTLRTRVLRRPDLDEFVACYQAKARSRAAATWHPETNPTGRWRSFTHREILSREKASMDILWLSDETGDTRGRTAPPGELAQSIVNDLQTALSRFQAVATRLHTPRQF